MDHDDPRKYPLWSAWHRQRHQLLAAMRAEAASAILTIEGIGAELQPSDFGRFGTDPDGVNIFTWRGKPAVRFTFEPGKKPGAGLQLVVDRLYMKEGFYV